ncbi:MAG: hypothetical protein WB869_16860 [Candidatus Acidiferrales bacterium]
MPKNDPVVPATKAIPPAASTPAPTGIARGTMPQNARKGTEKALYVPMAQQQRIVQLRQMGKSVREISRREKRRRRTVNKVLLFNAAKMKEHMERSRAAFLGLTTPALQTIRQAMKKGDVDIAYRLLVDTGVVPQLGTDSICAGTGKF